MNNQLVDICSGSICFEGIKLTNSMEVFISWSPNLCPLQTYDAVEQLDIAVKCAVLCCADNALFMLKRKCFVNAQNKVASVSRLRKQQHFLRCFSKLSVMSLACE